MWGAELDSGEIRSKRLEAFGNLLGDYLQETLTTLAVHAKHFRNSEWLQKQDAADLAVLHGVATDKAIRLLEAAEAASTDEPTRP